MSSDEELDDEVYLRGPANHMKGIAVGGALHVTATHVHFVSHRFNLWWNHSEPYALADIVAVEERRTLGLIPNGFTITLRDGRRERFVVHNRADWIDVIDRLRGREFDGFVASLMGHVPDLVVPAMAPPETTSMAPTASTKAQRRR